MAYHLAFFAQISPPAYLFAVLSAAEAAVFIRQGMVRRRLAFRWSRDLKSATGTALIVVTMVLYPVWSACASHPYPQTPTFGPPCPTTTFTLGLQCFTESPAPRSPLVIPLLWCLVGTRAAFLFGAWPDLGLMAAAAVGIGLWLTAGRPRGAATA